jgi:hypothetical protein
MSAKDLLGMLGVGLLLMVLSGLPVLVQLAIGVSAIVAATRDG